MKFRIFTILYHVFMKNTLLQNKIHYHSQCANTLLRNKIPLHLGHASKRKKKKKMKIEKKK